MISISLPLFDKQILVSLLGNFLSCLVFFIFMPGLGQGFVGLFLRAPLILPLALFATFTNSHPEGVLENELFFLINCSLKGAILALVPQIIVSCFRLVGYFVGLNAGAGLVGIFNPGLNQADNDFARLVGDFQALALLFSGVHYFFLKALLDQRILFDFESAEVLLTSFYLTFSYGVIILIPFLAVNLLLNIFLGLISKAVPTFNVFIFGYPVSILVAVFFLIQFTRESQSLLTYIVERLNLF